MIPLVHTAYEEWLPVKADETTLEWQKTHCPVPPKLFISDLGKCPRQACFSAVWHLPDHPFHRKETHPFTPYVQKLMRQGIIDEADTTLALWHTFGIALHCQLAVGDDVWLGHPDFFIEPDDIVVEHKATNAMNFVRKDGLPYTFHCLQVLAYAKYLRQSWDREIEARLYYRTHGHWAEFVVEDHDDFVRYEGHLNGHSRIGELPVRLTEEMLKIEEPWLAGKLPPRYEQPDEVLFTCSRNTKDGLYPSCKYWGACWPELPQQGPFELSQ